MTRGNETVQNETVQAVCPKTGRPIKDSRSFRRLKWVFPVLGLASCLWFLIRVIPKPSRAAYPCQRFAAPLASSFVVWLLGIVGSALAYQKARRLLDRARYTSAAVVLALAVGVIWLCTGGQESGMARVASSPSELLDGPIGIGQGLHPGRVVWVHEPEATSWDGVTGAWWEDEHVDQVLVDGMISLMIQTLTGQDENVTAWDALFRDFNQTHGLDDVGYSPGERIAIKINMNQDDGGIWAWAPDVGLPSPQVVHALLDHLINMAGVPGEMITLYDASRAIGAPIYDKVRSNADPNFQNVRFVVRPDKARDGRLAATPDMAHPVWFGGPNAQDGTCAYLPYCVTEAKYLINVALLRAHQMAGVTLCAKNHFGSIYFDTGSDIQWSPELLHDFARRFQAPGSYNCLVDLMGHPHLGGKTLLYMIDGLYAAEHQNTGVIQFASFGDDWPSSLFASQDPVAIDSVALDVLCNEPRATYCGGQGLDNYLHEAALADDPPSGIFYDPEGDGAGLESLGVHEHWNNAEDKQYSRNLGAEQGIELIAVELQETTSETVAPVAGAGDW